MASRQCRPIRCAAHWPLGTETLLLFPEGVEMILRSARFTIPMIMSVALSTTAALQSPESSAAQESVSSWLTVVDAGRYSESWQVAAAYFKSSVSRDGWEVAIEAARNPLGRMISRGITSTTAANTLPGAPDGKYFIFQFDSSFEQKQRAQETVTVVREADGVYRLVGYFVR